MKGICLNRFDILAAWYEWPLGVCFPRMVEMSARSTRPTHARVCTTRCLRYRPREKIFKFSSSDSKVFTEPVNTSIWADTWPIEFTRLLLQFGLWPFLLWHPGYRRLRTAKYRAPLRLLLPPEGVRSFPIEALSQFPEKGRDPIFVCAADTDGSREQVSGAVNRGVRFSSNDQKAVFNFRRKTFHGLRFLYPGAPLLTCTFLPDSADERFDLEELPRRGAFSDVSVRQWSHRMALFNTIPMKWLASIECCGASAERTDVCETLTEGGQPLSVGSGRESAPGSWVTCTRLYCYSRLPSYILK